MQSEADERLLRALAEQLKLPLIQIARTAELARVAPDASRLEDISFAADTAMRLVDGFLLSAELHGAEPLPLEPVSIASILTDTAHSLEPLAQRYGCDVTVSLGGKYGPAMAHSDSLRTALLLIGYSLIESRPNGEKRHEVVLGAHKSSYGLVAGVFDNQPGLSTDVLRRGRALYGTARQTMPAFSATNAAGVYVADALLKAMTTSLRVARHHRLTGLAVTLHPSRQLALV